MSDDQQELWSSSPYAPKISYEIYVAEKANLAGIFVSTILYGACDHPNYTPANPCSIRSF